MLEELAMAWAAEREEQAVDERGGDCWTIGIEVQSKKASG